MVRMFEVVAVSVYMTVILDLGYRPMRVFRDDCESPSMLKIKKPRINAPHLECSSGFALSLPAKNMISIEFISIQRPNPNVLPVSDPETVIPTK